MADRSDTLGHALATDKAVVIIGAGTMGSGIAEVAACAGHAVYLRDTSPSALDRGMTQIRRSLDKRVERGRLGGAERDSIVARLHPVDADAKLDNIGLVIEVIVENLDVKVTVLCLIESQVGPGPRRSSRRTPRRCRSPRSPAASRGPSAWSGCTSSTRRRCCHWSR